MLYFATRGFAGTKISELAAFIGIGQGTLYSYFKSKENLFQEIYKRINRDSDIEQLKLLSFLPISAEKKIHKLTDTIMEKLENDETFAAVIALNTPMLLEQDADFSMNNTTYQIPLYEYTAKIIKQGQKQGRVVAGNPLKLADYYWGVVYLYSMKKLFTTKYEMISSADLERTLLKGERNHE
ncbi:MAG: TetR/AcrR family transcriptional regulator [Spirochaetaceae bacterium]|nr:TetR/AcrR family transcriptional regulator [Spirochaetaceae bacterium]